MAFNLPTYTGGQLAHPTTIPRNVTPGNPTDQEYSDAIVYTSDVIKCYRKLTQSRRVHCLNFLLIVITY
jgi:hypothetical protein